MRTLILLGGSVRAAAFSASRAGYAPYALDLYADRDLAALGPAVKISRYPYDFLAALAAAPQACWLYTGGLENYPRLIDRLAAVRPLLGNRSQALLAVRDLVNLKTVARDAGCLFPPTDLGDGVEVVDKGNCLLKPKRSSGGIAIRLATQSDSARPPHGHYWQQFVPGESASAVFIAAGGRALLLGATRQLLGRDFGLARPFLYIGSLGPLPLGANELSRLQSLGGILAERFGLVGLFNIDFVRNNDGLWAVEVNPRYSASMEVIERVRDVKSIDLHVRACESGDLPRVALSATNRCAGKAVVYATHDGVVPPSWDELVIEWNHGQDWPGLADLPQVGERLQAGQPVVTVFAEADSLASLETELRQRVATVQSLLGSGR